MPLLCSQLSLLPALPTSAGERFVPGSLPRIQLSLPGEGVAPGSFPGSLGPCRRWVGGLWFPNTHTGLLCLCLSRRGLKGKDWLLESQLSHLALTGGKGEELLFLC